MGTVVRNLGRLFIVASLLPSTGYSKSPFGYKGANLGMTADEVKALDLASKDRGDDSHANVYCTGEDTYKEAVRELQVSIADEKLNIFECGWFTAQAYGKAEIGVGDYATRSYDFYFGNLSDGQEPRLFRITMLVPTAAYSSVVAALAKKYGKPKTTDSKVKTKLGLTLNNQVARWDSGDSSIIVEKVAGTSETAWIEFELKKYAKHFNKLKSDLDAAQGPKM